MGFDIFAEKKTKTSYLRRNMHCTEMLHLYKSLGAEEEYAGISEIGHTVSIYDIRQLDEAKKYLQSLTINEIQEENRIDFIAFIDEVRNTFLTMNHKPTTEQKEKGIYARDQLDILL